MSHCVTIETQLQDKKILKKACEVLGIKCEEVKNYTMYDGTIVSGIAVYLKGWRYPAIIDSKGGIIYDNYNGSWGAEEELGVLKQRYAAEKSKQLAKMKGYNVKETIENGKIKLTINA